MAETGLGKISRRQLLASAGAATAGAAAGCTGRVRSILSRDGTARVTLSIAAMPADVDEASVRIARHLRSNLDAVGVSTTIDYYPREEFRLEFLVNQSFDIAVGPHPGGTDPDVLYGMFHSSFGPEGGWQNPYGFADLELDDLLDRQRTETGRRRANTVGEILELTARAQPIAPLCVPVDHRLLRRDRVAGVEGRTFDTSSDLLALTRPDGGPDGGRDDELVLSLGRTPPTENLNPLAVEHRKWGVLTGLMYDALAVQTVEGYRPWLAASVDWAGGDAEVTLREATWDDGEPVTASDVAFTYELLADTSLGELESPSPPPRFRGRSSLVSAVDVDGDREVTLSLAGADDIAWRALTVPVLPEHVWRDRTDRATTAGIVGEARTTDAVVADNIPPVGSGPYEFAGRSERDEVVVDRRADHFALTAEDLAAFRPPASRLRFVVAPSHAAARDWTRSGEVDLTVSPVHHETAESVEDPLVATSPAAGFYHLGYNTREQPLSNVQFRRLVSRLLDKRWVAESVFGGHAQPVATPLTADRWVPPSLAWDPQDGDPEVPFLGADGHLDADTARNHLVEMGYQYSEDGDLVAVGGS